MITNPMDVLKQFPIRKNAKQKETFRSAVVQYAEGLGYAVKVEKCSMGAQNVVIGDPENARYLVTAHYDTPARMFLPNFITPCNLTVYLGYQMLVLCIFFLAAFWASLVAVSLINTKEAALIGAYIGYFGMLFLMMLGPANRNNANDNTSGVVTLLEIAKGLPEEHRSKVCFVLFDLEEAGLIGSAGYRKAHKKATEQQIVLNLDCVGDGNEIVMFPTKKLKKNASLMDTVDKLSRTEGEKSLTLHRKGIAVCPSDQKNFPLAVGIMAFNRKKGIGLYCDRIHTNKDTILDENNVNFIRDALFLLLADAEL